MNLWMLKTPKFESSLTHLEIPHLSSSFSRLLLLIPKEHQKGEVMKLEQIAIEMSASKS